MDKKILEKIKETLEKERTSTEAQLLEFAKKDVKLKGDWDTKFPEMDTLMGSASDEALEDKAKRIEEYEKLLPVEYALEKKLQSIDLALEKLGKGKYGICEKCGKKIPEERLEVCPEARICMKCQES